MKRFHRPFSRGQKIWSLLRTYLLILSISALSMALYHAYLTPASSVLREGNIEIFYLQDSPLKDQFFLKPKTAVSLIQEGAVYKRPELISEADKKLLPLSHRLGLTKKVEDAGEVFHALVLLQSLGETQIIARHLALITALPHPTQEEAKKWVEENLRLHIEEGNLETFSGLFWVSEFFNLSQLRPATESLALELVKIPDPRGLQELSWFILYRPECMNHIEGLATMVYFMEQNLVFLLKKQNYSIKNLEVALDVFKFLSGKDLSKPATPQANNQQEMTL